MRLGSLSSEDSVNQRVPFGESTKRNVRFTPNAKDTSELESDISAMMDDDSKIMSERGPRSKKA